MRMDLKTMIGDLPGTLALLQEAKSRGWAMVASRVERLCREFESCEDETMRHSFSVSCGCVLGFKGHDDWVYS